MFININDGSLFHFAASANFPIFFAVIFRFKHTSLNLNIQEVACVLKYRASQSISNIDVTR